MTADAKALLMGYDCQICGEVHLLTAKWSANAQYRILRAHKVDIGEEMVSTLLAQAKRSFLDKHPGCEFDVKRLVRDQKKLEAMARERKK